MNKIILIMTSLLFFGLTANGQTSKDNYSIQVDGLGCPFCAYGLEKKFKEFKSIDDVNINMENGMFTFTYPDDQPLSVEKVENQVTEAGYTPVTTKIVRSNGNVEESSMEEHTISETATIVNSEIRVEGNCGMCQARIEKVALMTEGVVTAEWDKKTKVLSVSFDDSVATVSSISMAIAKSGHDSGEFKAETEVYNNLPGCCQYDRVEK